MTSPTPHANPSLIRWEPIARRPGVSPQTEAGGADPDTHYTTGALDTRTLAAIAAYMARLTHRPVSVTSALVLWAHEVVVSRDERGQVRGVHGFGFVDLVGAGPGYRVVYTIFSIVDEAARARVHAGQLFARLYKRERDLHAPDPIVWANAPGCDQEFSFSVEGTSALRRLVMSAKAQLPLNLRIFTDGPLTPGAPTHVPPPVEDAICTLVRYQRELEMRTRMGHGNA